MDVVVYENNPDAGHYLMGVQAAVVMAGAIAAYQEKTGTCLSYTNFSLGEKFKFKMKSKRAMLGVTTMTRVLQALGATSLASILSCPSCSTSSPDNRILILATALSLHFCKRILEVTKEFFALLNRTPAEFLIFFFFFPTLFSRLPETIDLKKNSLQEFTSEIPP
jgi:hypothetical protein